MSADGARSPATSIEPVRPAQRGGGISAALPFSPRGLALTVVAMCVFGAAVFWWARPGDAAVDNAMRAALPAGASSPPVAMDATPSSRVTTQSLQLADARQASPARHDPNAEPHDTPPARPEDFPVYDANAQSPVETASADTSGVDPANQRADDIRSAGQGSGAAQLASLTMALRSDELARNRLLAINGLRNLAADPALAPQVLDALRAAQSDRDANVARHARDAVDELTRR